MGSPLLKAAQSAMKAAGSLGATKAVTLRRASSVYDPATGVSTPTNTDYSWTVVVSHYTDGLVNGSSIMRGDRRLLGAAADIAVTPAPETDSIVMDSLVWQIVNDGTVSSGVQTDPATATWTVQVRR
jgi:hypothetical protein